MTAMVIGATGATGKHLTKQLLKSGQSVKIIVRSTSNIPEDWIGNSKLIIIKRSLSEITIEEMSGYIANCEAVALCLGHKNTLKGVFGNPRKLVTDTVRLLYEAIIRTAREEPIRIILMNTAGNRNKGIDEQVSTGQKILTALLRLLLPPFSDNEMAADFLRVRIGQNYPEIEWAAVRPDSLINEENVSAYSVYVSPIRSALSNPGRTSRINVGHFMARLITDEETWHKWKGQMPVIYNDQD